LAAIYVTADDTPTPERRNAVTSGLERVLGLPERGVFSLLGHFVPADSAIRSWQFQHLLTAKFLADAARDSVKYAAIVGVVRDGGSPLASSFIGLASVIPAIIFALYGGAIADSLPKRVALGIAYTADAAVCIALPVLFGDDVLVMFSLVFIVTSLTQIASPAEQTMVPLVTNERQLATANSIMGMVSSIGTAIGTAFMAPILLKAFGTETVFFTAAVLLLLAMTRILQVSSPRDVQRARWVRPRSNARAALRWLSRNRSIGTMVAVSAIAGVGYTIVTTLAPNYVAEVLDTDPANTVYVMGVAGVGMTLSLFAVPTLIRMMGERAVAGMGFVLLAAGLIGLGLIDSGAVDFLQVINPFYYADQIVSLGPGVSEEIQLAMFVSFPVGFGVGMTDNSVKTYLNRRVPILYQGRTFAVRNLTEAALTVVPLLAVSALATVAGVSVVLLATPIVLYGVAISLVRISSAIAEEPPDQPRQGVLQTYWEESDTGALTDMGDDEPSEAPAPA
jgi:MFS family permease